MRQVVTSDDIEFQQQHTQSESSGPLTVARLLVLMLAVKIDKSWCRSPASIFLQYLPLVTPMDQLLDYREILTSIFGGCYALTSLHPMVRSLTTGNTYVMTIVQKRLLLFYIMYISAVNTRTASVEGLHLFQTFITGEKFTRRYRLLAERIQLVSPSNILTSKHLLLQSTKQFLHNAWHC